MNEFTQKQVCICVCVHMCMCVPTYMCFCLHMCFQFSHLLLKNNLLQNQVNLNEHCFITFIQNNNLPRLTWLAVLLASIR